MKYSAYILTAIIAIQSMLARDVQANRFDAGYGDVIRRTVSMVSDQTARRYAEKYGLNILDLTWEDAGRYKNSSVGPNISDMTIQVVQKDRRGRTSAACMPVIRFPNFSDRTGDISADKFYLLVGNEDGGKLKKITLTKYLENIRRYMSSPDSWEGSEKSLLTKRDDHILVSAQACFLPIPHDGEAEFNPVLFNYQSYEGDPAVLTILATREGTSVTVIDNKRDGFNAGGVWGQRLFFNQDGERASLTGRRMSDFTRDVKNGEVKGMTMKQLKKEKNLNMVMLIQVPLKQKRPMRYEMEDMATESSKSMAPMAECAKPSMKRSSNVENAVIGHSEAEGPYTEMAGLEIERDPAFPIRVTVQFYKATDNGIVSQEDMDQIAMQIEKVYSEADYVGSLVTGGNTGRPTEYIGDKNEPSDWWSRFWNRHDANLSGEEEKGVVFGW